MSKTNEEILKNYPYDDNGRYAVFMENDVLSAMTAARKDEREKITDVTHRLSSNPDILEWWKTQNFQKEQGEQGYMIIYEIDLPKILKAFSEYLLNGA